MGPKENNSVATSLRAQEIKSVTLTSVYMYKWNNIYIYISTLCKNTCTYINMYLNIVWPLKAFPSTVLSGRILYFGAKYKGGRETGKDRRARHLARNNE